MHPHGSETQRPISLPGINQEIYEPACALLLVLVDATLPRLFWASSILNCSTRWRSSVDVCTSCCAAFWVSVAPRDVLSAASATPAMLLVISPLPCAASLTLRAISLVVAFCSSTAVAMVLEMPLI